MSSVLVLITFLQNVEIHFRISSDTSPVVTVGGAGGWGPATPGRPASRSPPLLEVSAALLTSARLVHSRPRGRLLRERLLQERPLEGHLETRGTQESSYQGSIPKVYAQETLGVSPGTRTWTQTPRLALLGLRSGTATRDVGSFSQLVSAVVRGESGAVLPAQNRAWLLVRASQGLLMLQMARPFLTPSFPEKTSHCACHQNTGWRALACSDLSQLFWRAPPGPPGGLLLSQPAPCTRRTPSAPSRVTWPSGHTLSPEPICNLRSRL